MVERLRQRSAKPVLVGSTPTHASIFCAFGTKKCRLYRVSEQKFALLFLRSLSLTEPLGCRRFTPARVRVNSHSRLHFLWVQSTPLSGGSTHCVRLPPLAQKTVVFIV